MELLSNLLVRARLLLKGLGGVSCTILSLLCCIHLVGFSYFACQRAVRVRLTIDQDLVLDYFVGLIHCWFIDLGVAGRVGLVGVALHLNRFWWRRYASFVFRGHDFVDDDKLVNFWSFHLLHLILVSAVILAFICRAIRSFQVSHKTVVLWLSDGFLVFFTPAFISL